MKSRKAAKILIKRAKTHPDLYTAQEVLYAKLFRKHESKTNNFDTERRGNDGLRGEGEQSEQSRQPKRKWFAWLLYKASTLVSF